MACDGSTTAREAWALPDTLQSLLLDAGGRDFVLELIDVFKSQTRAQLQSMREACMAGRLEGIRAQAHAMKGSSHQMGVRLLAEVCLEIETTAEQNRELTTKLVIHAQELFEETCGMMILPSPR